jgi:hypothetical protein
MRSRHLLVIASVLSTVIFNCWAQSPTRLLIEVRHPDGRPASGVKIQLVQLTRSFPRNLLVGTTDEKGEFKMRFESGISKDDEHYGWGVYRFVLMPADSRWELSDIYYWNQYSPSDEAGIGPEESYRSMSAEKKTNWSFGNVTRLQQAETQTWKVSLQRGEDIMVSAIDQFGHALPRSKFRVFLDTDMLSHTGGGGEVPMFSLQSNERGQILVPHAADFFYSFDYECTEVSAGQCEYCSPDVAFYFTTVVTDKINPTSATIVYQKRIPRSISITVVNKSTRKPIPGATINEIVSFNSAAMGGPIGSTDQNGHFQTDSLFTEHVLSIGAYKEGYLDYKLDMKDFRPGVAYVFELQQK